MGKKLKDLFYLIHYVPGLLKKQMAGNADALTLY